MRTINKCINKSIYLLVNVLALAFTLIIFVFGCMNWNLKGTCDYINSDVKVLVLSVVGILCLILTGNFIQKAILKQKAVVRNSVYIAIMLGVLVLQVYSAVRYQVLLGWDNTDTLVSAISIVSGQEELFQTGYFEMCPNQRCFLISTASIVWLFDKLGFSYAALPVILSIISCICVDIAIYFVYLAVKEIRNREFAEKTLFWMLINPGLIYWGIYYYTTNVSILITVMTVWGIIKLWKGKIGYVPCFLLGMLAMFGFQYRATLIIVFVAMVIMALFGKYRKSLRQVVVWIAGFVLMYFIIQSLYNHFIPELDKNKQLPFTHWLMMGAQGVGELTDEDVYYTTSFPTYEEKKAATVEMLKSRIREMGVSGYLRLAGRKITYIWAYGDRGYSPEFQYYDSISFHIWGNRNIYFVYYQQMYYMMIVLFMIIGILKHIKEFFRKKSEDTMLFPIMIFVGAVLFYIMWEGDQYYGVAFWGIMQICAADGCNKVSDMAMSVRKGMYLVLCAASVLPVAFLLKDAPEWNVKGNNPVVTQTKVSDTLFFDGDNVVEQTFVAGSDFDTIDLWLTKEKRKDDSGAVYEIILEGKERGTILKETVYCQDVLRTIEFVKTFDRIDMKEPEEFSLIIRTVKDDPENRLGIPYYCLPVEVYQYGDLLKDGIQLPADLRFQVYLSDV